MTSKDYLLKVPEEAKPCPACLGDRVVVETEENYTNEYFVQCASSVFECPYEVRGFIASTVEQALDNWNHKWHLLEATRRINCRKTFWRKGIQ